MFGEGLIESKFWKDKGRILLGNLTLVILSYFYDILFKGEEYSVKDNGYFALTRVLFIILGSFKF